MPLVNVAGLTREIDLVVFDKDGTLIDFDRLWAGKLAAAVEATLAAIGPAGDIEERLYAVLGVDRATGAIVPESPIAVASLPTLSIVCATVLYQAGLPWHDAETMAARHFRPMIQAPPEMSGLRPIGDMAGQLARLKAAGLRLAILTSDDRTGTMASLPLLSIGGMVDFVSCGDDPVANKPEPDGLIHLAGLAGVDLSRVMMVGDSAGDMITARRAGAGLAVGVLSGTGRREQLETHADIVVEDLHAIRVTG